jgi:hypothetical protein
MRVFWILSELSQLPGFKRGYEQAARSRDAFCDQHFQHNLSNSYESDTKWQKRFRINHDRTFPTRLLDFLYLYSSLEFRIRFIVRGYVHAPFAFTYWLKVAISESFMVKCS